jgi:hypothetical protein
MRARARAVWQETKEPAHQPRLRGRGATVLKYRRLSCMQLQAWTLDESQLNCSTPSEERQAPGALQGIKEHADVSRIPLALIV